MQQSVTPPWHETISQCFRVSNAVLSSFAHELFLFRKMSGKACRIPRRILISQISCATLYLSPLIPFTYATTMKVHAAIACHTDFTGRVFHLYFSLPFPFSFFIVSSTFNDPFGLLFNFRSLYLFAIGFENIFRFRWNIPPLEHIAAL